MIKITFNVFSVIKEKGALFALLFFVGLSAFSQENLITNGDIESSGGWRILQYSNVAPSGTSQPKQYAVVTNAQQFNNAFVNTTSRTGSGNFLAFDMLTDGGQQHFLQMGTNGGGICALNTSVTHTFSYWVRTLSNGSRPEIDVLFNNASNVQLVSGSKTTPDVNAGWQQVVYTFTPTNNCVYITFRHTNSNNLPDGSGNDFALDDFSLTAPPPALTIDYYSNAASCPNNSDASIEAYRFGGTAPFTFTLNGTTTQTNATGIFTGLPAGSYTVTVNDGAGGSAITPSINLDAPIDITTSPNVSICAGDSTTLTASGSTGVYNWVANPADASITDPSSASQNVSPSQTTTYTVSSTVVTNASIATNLIVNPSFSDGNTGFVSDYTFTADNSIAKAQKAYGVVANPKLWEPDFTTCGDRTSSNNDGLMMVVDGSITAGNNDKVWSQTINGLKQNTFYIFSYWVQSVAAINPADLETQINGVAQGNSLAPGQSCGWVRRFYKWNSGLSTTATIDIIDRNIILAGNDFALDEMSFAEAVLCDLQKQVTVTVNPIVQPTFTFNTSYNVGDVPVALPAASDNGITGTWSPATIDTSVAGSVNYTFTPNDPTQCGAAISRAITVNNTLFVDPTFTLPAIICRGTVVNLPTTSDNGITGTWNPASVDNTQSASYLFTPDAGQNANTFAYNLTVNQPIVPTFNNLPSNTACENGAVGVLPTASVEGITGTWSGVLDSSILGLTTYTFTPDAGQCASSVPFEFTVTAPIVPTFNNLPSNSTCENGAVGVLPTVSTEGITGTWLPAVDTSIVGLTNYTFTPDAGQCATPTTFGLTVTAPTVPTFNNLPSNTTCLNGAVGVLPTVSTEGITGTWSGVLDSSVLGVTTYTFTPDAGQCASSVPFNFTVTPLTVPTFNNLPSSTTCQNGAVGVLPIVSTEGITGSWSGVLDSTILGLTTYTFTPDAGQCAAPTTFGLTVAAPTAPTFNNLPSNTACQNGAVGVLPTVSTEGITGTWSGALDSTILGLTTYTFTPDAGQCAAPTTFGLTVTAPIVPTFNGMPNATVCQNENVNPLPTTSVEGITGTWSPALDLNVLGLTIYTFTPDAGQCAQGTGINLTVNAAVTPNFNGLPNPVACQNENVNALPTTSVEGITGTWSPAISTATVGSTIYTFTPDAGQCANSFPFTLTVNPTITDVALNGDCVQTEYIVEATPVANSFDPNTVTYAWTDSSGAPIGNGTSKLNVSALNLSSFPATVSVRITNGSGCGITKQFDVQTDFCEIPKGVSPNGDGKNDTFDLIGLNPKLVQIFNRYGVKVFEATNYTNQWNGQTTDGDELPAATYYYVVEFKSGETKAGWVYLTR